MTRFLVRRIMLGLAVLWVITTSVFVMFYVAPHDVARTIALPRPEPSLFHNSRTRRVCALVVTIIVVRSFSFAIAAAIALISSAVFTVGGSRTRIASAGTPS